MPNPNEEPSHEGGPEDVGALTAAAGELHIADTSDWNPNFDGAAYAAGGRSGIIIKATEGLSFVASTLAAHRATAHAARLVFIGLYHFARTNSPALAALVASLAPTEAAAFHPHWSVDGKGRYRYHRSPVAVTHAHLGLAALPLAAFAANAPGGESGHFVSTVGPLQPGEVAVLDAEVPGIDADWCIAFAQGVRQEFGPVEILLYCSWAYWFDVLKADARLHQHFRVKWIAAYPASGTPSPAGDPRGDVGGALLWQYSDHAQVPGIGSCDDSVFAGSIDDLAELAGTTAPPPPDPPKEPDVSKIAFRADVPSGESRRVSVPAIGGGFGWTKASVTFSSPGVDVRRAVVGPNERAIGGLAPDGVASSVHFDGRGYVDLVAGDEWVEVVLDPTPIGTLDLMVEASDAPAS